jgi:hypothetical protein
MKQMKMQLRADEEEGGRKGKSCVRARDASIDGLQAAPTHTNGDSTQAEETFALAFAGGGGGSQRNRNRNQTTLPTHGLRWALVCQQSPVCWRMLGPAERQPPPGRHARSLLALRVALHTASPATGCPLAALGTLAWLQTPTSPPSGDEASQ